MCLSPSCILFNWKWLSFSRGKFGDRSWYFTISNDEVKSVWSYTNTPQFAFIFSFLLRFVSCHLLPSRWHPFNREFCPILSAFALATLTCLQMQAAHKPSNHVNVAVTRCLLLPCLLSWFSSRSVIIKWGSMTTRIPSTFTTNPFVGERFLQHQLDLILLM